MIAKPDPGWLVLVAGLLGAAALGGEPVPVQVEPLVLGETFSLESKALQETRRVNVWVPPGGDGQRFPVLYMPDGGIGEDFPHLMGLLQISALNGTMRPFILVGVENTERRRDLTGPTRVESDREIAPRVGGSDAFRAFLRDELRPVIESRYPTSAETALIGESLAGLFAVETLLLEPTLFDTYLAVDPSLWWDDGRLVAEARQRLAEASAAGRTVFLAASSEPEISAATAELAEALRGIEGLTVHHLSLPEESHATVFHPAALRAVRAVFGLSGEP